MMKSRMTKSFTVFITAVILIYSLQINSFAQFESLAGSAVLMEASTGKVLYEKEADIPKPPASITKVMTLLLAFEAIEKGQAQWDDMVRISEKAWRMEGSRMFLEVGTQVSYRDIITGISVVSANDGCIAIAEYLYGSENSFVQMMNKKAEEIGLTNTQFKNTTGLPEDGHYMSARDIAILARYILDRYPEILEFESQREFTFNKIRQFNRNPLLGAFPGADGLKTGWTTEAGYCLVGTAEQNGIRMISVVLKTENEKQRLEASQELLNYGFKNFEFVEAIIPLTTVGEIEVDEGKVLTTPVMVNDRVEVYIPVNTANRLTFEFVNNEGVLKAPVSAGTLVGEYVIRHNGQVQASIPVMTIEDVERAGFFERLFRRINAFFKNLGRRKDS